MILIFHFDYLVRVTVFCNSLSQVKHVFMIPRIVSVNKCYITLRVSRGFVELPVDILIVVNFEQSSRKFMRIALASINQTERDPLIHKSVDPKI